MLSIMRFMPVSPENLPHAELFGLARQQVLTGRSLVESGANAIEGLARRIAMHEATLGDPITDFAVMRFGADASPRHISFFRGIQKEVASHVGELCALATELPGEKVPRERYKIGLLADPSLVLEAHPYPGKGVKAELFFPVSAGVKSGEGAIRTFHMNSTAPTTSRLALIPDERMRIDSEGTIIHNGSSLEILAEYLREPKVNITTRIIIGDELVGAWYDNRMQVTASGALKNRLVSAAQSTSQRSTTRPEVAQAR